MPAAATSDRLRKLSTIVFGLAITTAAVALGLGITVPHPEPVDLVTWVASVGLVLAYSTVGVVIARRPAGRVVGWLLLAVGLSFGLKMSATEYALLARHVGNLLPGGVLAAWLQGWIGSIAFPAAFPVLLLVFPDGRLPSARWRPLLAISLTSGVLVAARNLTNPGELIGGIQIHLGIDNPTGIQRLPGALDWLLELGWLLAISCTLAAGAALGLRYWRSEGELRQQIKWLALAGSVLAVTFALGLAVYLSQLASGGGDARLTQLPMAAFVLLEVLWIAIGIPCAIGIAVVRHRLYDVDALISRGLAYGILSVLVVAIYAGLVAALSGVFHQQGQQALAALVTVAVAIAFAPLRDRVQRRVDRLLYGERGDPYAVIDGLGRHLEAAVAPEQVLPTVVETVARTLKLRYVAVSLDGSVGELTAAVGTPPPEASERTELPITYQGDVIGRLVVGYRSSGERFSPKDLRLLNGLARQLGPAASALLLGNQLRLSRQRIVAAREEERRRLRRDLHDGLGPALAGVTLRLAAVRRALPAGSDELIELNNARDDLKQAMGDLRRVVNDLRPPVLDQLGLVAAISSVAEQVTDSGPLGLEVLVEASGDLNDLPAAVEVGAFRIVQEALTNVHRHAGARVCRVSILGGRVLRLEVVDDGRGISDPRSGGVGMTSMRERAEELGGTLVIRLGPGRGTRLVAELPLSRAGE
jgi:two-component system, NarL family, sensor kinase